MVVMLLRMSVYTIIITAIIIVSNMDLVLFIAVLYVGLFVFKRCVVDVPLL